MLDSRKVHHMKNEQLDMFNPKTAPITHELSAEEKRLEEKNRIKRKLAHCNGTEQYHRFNQFDPTLYATDGVMVLFEEARCYWIGDIIASIRPHFAGNVSEEFWVFELPVWRNGEPPEEIKDRAKKLYRRTSNEHMSMCVVHNGHEPNQPEFKRLYRQDIPFTDLALDYVQLFISCQLIEQRVGVVQQQKVVMLPSEY